MQPAKSHSGLKIDQDGNLLSVYGPDGAALLRAYALAGALDAAQRGFAVPGAKLDHMLSRARDITHKGYRPGQVSQAIEDIMVWCEAMELALPVETVP